MADENLTPPDTTEGNAAAIDEFARALAGHGLLLDGPPEMDGEFHTVPVVDGKPGKLSGSYWGSLDGGPHGYIENFLTGVKERWQGTGPSRPLSAEEQAGVTQRRRDRALERAAEQEKRAEIVGKEWKRLRRAQDDHGYLQRKGVLPHALRTDRHGNLVMPLVDIDDKFWSVQRISAAGDKLFTKGGRTAGAFSPIGDVHDASKPIVIAEGYATSASVYEITGLPVVVALNAGNLKPVAEAFRSKYPDRKIFIAGDNDHGKEAAGKPNVGKMKSADAAEAVGGYVLLPAFAADDTGTDWNDLAHSRGKAEVRAQIGEALAAHGITLGASMGKEARVYLNVPFKEKDEVNELGGSYDGLEKRWYVPPGVDPAPFDRWKLDVQPAPTIGQARPAAAMPTPSTAPAEPIAAREAPAIDADPRIEREAQRMSALLGEPIENTRELVTDLLKRVEENGGPQARAEFFADRATLSADVGQQPAEVAPTETARIETAPVDPAVPSDEQLGRSFRATLQSIVTSVTLRGPEVNETLALEERLEAIHRDAWRQTGQAAEGDRAIGALIRSGTDFAAEVLPPRAAAALAELRLDAGLGPRESVDALPESPAPEPLGLREAVRDRREEIEDEQAVTFADLADGLEEIARPHEQERPAVNSTPADEVSAGEPKPADGDSQDVTLADVGEAAVTAAAVSTPAPLPEVGNVRARAGNVDTAPSANESTDKKPANEAFPSALSEQGMARVRATREQELAEAAALLRAQQVPPIARTETAPDSSIDQGAAPRENPAPASEPRAPSRDTARSTKTEPDAADNAIELESSLRKPILTKDGYDVPAAIAARYMTKDGRFWKLDTAGPADVKPGERPQPQFEDKGPRLTSRHNDLDTIGDMVAVIQVKNWDSATVKGSETFRRNAWVKLSLAGVEVHGFKPKEADYALLEAAKREREALTISGARPSAPSPAAAPVAAPSPATSEASSTPAPSPAAPVAANTSTTVEQPTSAEATKPGEPTITQRNALTVEQMREQLGKATERMPARSRTELLNRFDARIQAALDVQSRVDRGEVKPEAAGAAIDSRFAEMHASWTAPKAAPTAGKPKPDAQPTPVASPKVM